MDQFGNNHVSVGKSFSKPSIKNIKEDLQIEHGSKLSLTSSKKFNQVAYLLIQVFIKCKEVLCPFQLTFNKSETTTLFNEESFVLTEEKDNHTCQSDEVNKLFYNRRKFLMSQIENIRQIMLEHMIKKKQRLLPLEIMGQLARRIDQKEDFLYEDLPNPHMKRKLKKKFDNIVNDLKKEVTHEYKEYKKFEMIDSPEEEEEEEERSVLSQKQKKKKKGKTDLQEEKNKSNKSDRSFGSQRNPFVFTAEHRGNRDNLNLGFEMDPEVRFSENNFFNDFESENDSQVEEH